MYFHKIFILYYISLLKWFIEAIIIILFYNNQDFIKLLNINSKLIFYICTN